MSAMSALSGRSPAEGSIAGRPVVLHYGDIATEYAALRAGAMLVDRDARGRMRLDGARAAEMIAGLVTNDVQALTAGTGAYAAALNPRGKIVADVRTFVFSDHLAVDVPPRAVEGWQAMVRKYINPRIARYEDQSASRRQIGIFGMRSRRMRISRCRRWPTRRSLRACRTWSSRGTRSSCRPTRATTPGTARRMPAPRGPVCSHSRSRASRRAVLNGDSTWTRPPFRRKPTSTSCTPFRTPRDATWDRRWWRACTSAAT